MSLDRIQALRKTLHDHNFRYYISDNPIISDFEFDKLLFELSELEQKYPDAFDPNSPTQRVGGEIVKSFDSVVHRRPMLSLSNSYNQDEITAFIKRCQSVSDEELDLSVELKYDGVAISLCYENRKLIRAVTRGDGVNGDDVSVNIRTIKNIPLILPNVAPNELEVRGEVYFTSDAFEDLNKKRFDSDGTKFANPRNAASGTLKLQDSFEVATRRLSALMYSVYSDEFDFKTHIESLRLISEWGFPVPNQESGWIRSCKSVDDIFQYLSFWDTERHSLPFAIDGAVIKVNSILIQEKIGFTAKSPRWAIAYKFNSEKVLTRLREVKYQIGRTGAITPVAVLDPVWISGTVVRRASIHNADQIAKLNLHEGDSVWIEKGGEIIPKILEVEISKRLIGSNPIKFILNCPDCHSLLERKEGDAQHYCLNMDTCKPQIKGRLNHFIHRKSMNIDGVGTETIDQLVEIGLVHKPSNLYELDEEDWFKLDKFRDKSVKNVLAGIEKSKMVSFERVLFSIGIRHVGSTVAKKLSKHFGSIDSLINASESELLDVEDIGPMIAKSLRSYFSNQSYLLEIEKLRAIGLNFKSEVIDKSGNKLVGFSFVISGVFEFFSRDEIKKSVEDNGGKIVSSVSSKTDYLLMGSGVGPSKIKKADLHGVKRLTENEFLRWIGSSK